MNRRNFLGAMLAAGMAPAIVRASSLMPVIARVAPIIRKGGGVRWVPIEERVLMEIAERTINPALILDSFDIDKMVLEMARVYSVPARMLRNAT